MFSVLLFVFFSDYLQADCTILMKICSQYMKKKHYQKCLELWVCRIQVCLQACLPMLHPHLAWGRPEAIKDRWSSGLSMGRQVQSVFWEVQKPSGTGCFQDRPLVITYRAPFRMSRSQYGQSLIWAVHGPSSSERLFGSPEPIRDRVISGLSMGHQEESPLWDALKPPGTEPLLGCP